MIAQVSDRQMQALRQVGQTEISPLVSRLVIGLFLVTIVVVPVIDGLGRVRPGDREVPNAGGEVTDSIAASNAPGPTAKPGSRFDRRSRSRLLTLNHSLHLAMRRAENRLEDDSSLRGILLPPVQQALSGLLGLGNEQVYTGREGWLFYRADVDHLTAAPFLDEKVLDRRSRAGDSWSAPPVPDPLPALRRLGEDLAKRGIALVVVPTPVKPAIYPDKLSNRFQPPDRPVRNGSSGRFTAALEESGIRVFDPGPVLLELRAEGVPAYLKADTHWTPAAVERVAERLAQYLENELSLMPATRSRYFRRVAVTEGLGDIAEMLLLPTDQQLYTDQEVNLAMVLDQEGRLWRPDREAEIMLLGDSFTNVFSDAALGWGAGAGLAEQLSVELGRAIDRIALNAGGSLAVRRALRREVASVATRLDGKRVVVYQFATRELTQGDWEPIPLEQ